MPRRLSLLVVAAGVALVWAGGAVRGQTARPAAVNALSAEEKAAGWILLFDGKSTAEWRGFRRQAMPPEGWVVEDGTLKHVKGQVANGGDIITINEYSSFEFKADWKISPGGNSGIKYLISEDLVKSGYGGLGFEMQVLDDDLNPDAKLGRDGNRRAGALYDLIPASPAKKLVPVGQWNEARLVVRGAHVEHWLNGVKLLEFEIGSPAIKALIAESKYKVNPGFGEVRRGHILLQDHNEEVWYRNLKVRELK